MPSADFTNAIPQTKALPADLDYKGCEFAFKALDDSGRFQMYVAAFGNVDRGGDILEAGAFKNVDEYQRSGWIGVNHQMNGLPVAYPIRVVQDSRGLLIEGQFHSTQAAQECRAVVTERMKAGKQVSGSIGYKVRPNGARPDYIDGKSVRRLTDVDVYEASFVNLPMNPNANAISAKSLTSLEGLNVNDGVMTIEALKSWLDMQTKAGRVLSKANHGKLKEWHGTLTTMCNDMKTLVDTYDPDRPDGDDGADDDKAATNQRLTAGNAIPADQNPRGAVIASDIPKSAAEIEARTAKAISELRARAVRAQMQFALLP